MKLLRLKLNVPFRSLAAGFEIYFLREWDYDRAFQFHPYCLAGRNGSGKSNVLEAIAAIFYQIECMHLNYNPESFEFDSENAIPDAFELEYLVPNNGDAASASLPTGTTSAVFHVRIAKLKGKSPVVQRLDTASNGEVIETALFRHDVKAYLPTYILGYSSGHNEILSLPFFKMRFIRFDEYRDLLARDLDYGTTESRMIYLDEQFSQVILLCHFLFPSDAVTRVFEKEIGLKGIRRFRLIIRRHYRVDVAHERLSSMSREELADYGKRTVELTTKLATLLDKLVKCSTVHFESFSNDDNEVGGSDLVLDYLVNEETQKAFKFHFGATVGGSEELSKAESALNLFLSLQTLLTLNYYQVSNQTKADLYTSSSLYVNETIPLPASDERIMRFKDFEISKAEVSDKLYGKSLSDGEHQLIHTIGLCLLFRHKPALFLLDEPETHLNPDWRASYISTLREALEADAATKDIMREVLLTSHSPFIISDCQKGNVLVFEKDENGKVGWHNPDFNTFGASVNAITIKIFGQKESIGDYAGLKLNGIRGRLVAGEDPETLINEVNDVLGDSVEKILFINQALNRKEGK
jgi:restriction system-associated AAA family ATPase